MNIYAEAGNADLTPILGAVRRYAPAGTDVKASALPCDYDWVVTVGITINEGPDQTRYVICTDPDTDPPPPMQKVIEAAAEYFAGLAMSGFRRPGPLPDWMLMVTPQGTVRLPPDGPRVEMPLSRTPSDADGAQSA